MYLGEYMIVDGNERHVINEECPTELKRWTIPQEPWTDINSSKIQGRED